jgi:hypothetical protein
MTYGDNLCNAGLRDAIESAPRGKREMPPQTQRAIVLVTQSGLAAPGIWERAYCVEAHTAANRATASHS